MRKVYKTESRHLLVIFLLIISCVAITYYYHFILHTTVVFSHFFYVPIAISCLWWKRRGIWVAILLGMWLITSSLLAGMRATLLENILRSGMFIVIALIINRLREETQDIRKELHDIIESIPIALFVIDKNHNVTYWNKACEILTGLSAKEIIGTKKHWMSLYKRERPTLADLIVDNIPRPDEVKNRDYPKCKWWKSRVIEWAYKGEGFFPEVGKEGRWLHLTAAPIKDTYGQIIGAVETLEDITRIKNTETQLFQIQKMDSLGRLAAGIAHEFNNVLHVIQGNIEIALLDTKPESKLHTCLTRIQKAASQAAGLVHQLLIFLQKAPIKTKVFNLNQTVIEIRNMLKHILRKDIFLELKLEEDLWKIEGNPNMIEQVILNLVGNAQDAMPNGGKVVIKTENILNATKNGVKRHVCLSVKDTGIGMSEEVKEHLFEPFFTTKKNGKRTGLGLSVVYGIVKQHRGWIEVESAPGKGATFYIYFPASSKIEENIL